MSKKNINRKKNKDDEKKSKNGKNDKENKNDENNNKNPKKNIILVVFNKKKNENEENIFENTEDMNDHNKENNMDEEDEEDDEEEEEEEEDEEEEDEEDEEEEEEEDDDDDEDYIDDENIFDETKNDEIETKDQFMNELNKSNRKRKSYDDSFDSFFNIILGSNPVSAINPIDTELVNKRTPSKKKQRKEKFHDYFKESNKLLPIDTKIDTLEDLIMLGEKYDENDDNRYVINLRALHKCVGPLKELNAFIGMKNIKKMIIDLMFFRLQNFEDNQNEMWHLVIQGSPGCGKTEVSKIIGKLYYGLGIVDKEDFTQVKRSELIGKYLGHTAAQTQDIFDKAEGGVLFIDEAYSLGNPEGRDNFSKECIDTINQNLTEKKNTVVIIAGYKEQLNESFFSYNPGLARRFKMRMTIDSYNHHDLREIYIKKIKESNWKILDDIEKEIPIDFFEKNRNIFKYNGGDMENLWSLTKIVHARRVFGKSNDIVKKISKKDLENALELYKENDEVSARDNDLKKYIINTMYC